MTTLAFDTSTSLTTLALADENGKILAKAQNHAQQGQAKEIIPLINAMFEDAGLDISTLSSVLVINGPGSFTGLRLGLATAAGLKLASTETNGTPKIKAHAFSAFDVLQHAVDSSSDKMAYQDYPLIILLDTKRNDFFATIYDRVKNGTRTILHPPRCISLEECFAFIKQYPKALIAGHGMDLLSGHKQEQQLDVSLLSAFTHPTAERLLAYWHNNKKIENEDLSPYYLRPAYVYEANN